LIIQEEARVGGLGNEHVFMEEGCRKITQNKTHRRSEGSEIVEKFNTYFLNDPLFTEAKIVVHNTHDVI